jgi:hypothetical protein
MVRISVDTHGCSRQHRGDGVHQATPGRPRTTRLRRNDSHPHHPWNSPRPRRGPPGAIRVHLGRDQAVHADGPVALARLRSIRTCTGLLSHPASVPETVHEFVQLCSHRSDLRLRQGLTPREAASLLPADRHTEQVRHCGRRGQRPLDGAAVLQEREEIRSVLQLQDRQLDHPDRASHSRIQYPL